MYLILFHCTLRCTNIFFSTSTCAIFFTKVHTAEKVNKGLNINLALDKAHEGKEFRYRLSLVPRHKLHIRIASVT